VIDANTYYSSRLLISVGCLGLCLLCVASFAMLPNCVVVLYLTVFMTHLMVSLQDESRDNKPSHDTVRHRPLPDIIASISLLSLSGGVNTNHFNEDTATRSSTATSNLSSYVVRTLIAFTLLRECVINYL